MSRLKPRAHRRKKSGGIVLLTVLFSILAVLLLGLATLLENRIELMALSIGCMLFAIVIYPWSGKERAFTESDDGIVLGDTGDVLAWDQLVDCRIRGYRVSPAYADSGNLIAKFDKQHIALKFTDPAQKSHFYREAWLRIVANIEPKLDPLLMQVLATERQKHPTGEVIAAGSQGSFVGVTVPARLFLATFLLTMSGFVGVMLVRIPTISVAVLVVGMIMLLAVGLLTLREKFRRSKSTSGNAGWVMSPTRFALRSKTLSGEMKWSELKAVELKPNSRKPKMLRLRLEGVDINLLEEYQLPLWYLYQNIESFRSKYSAIQVASDPAVSISKVTPPITSSNPYSPPTMD